MVSPVLAWIAAALVVLAGVAGWFARRRGEKGRRVLVANSAYLFSLPSFRWRLLLRRTAVVSLAAVTLAAGVVAALLAGRPVDRTVQDERLAARDIVLCLDVSGSMLPFDAEVLGAFEAMVPSFQGERIALNIWNATTRVVFPLTDDYAVVEEELRVGAELLSIDFFSPFTSPEALRRLEEWFAGTITWTESQSSLIGDGLANCVMSFDLADTERARTIILATDNQVAGVPVFTLPEAAEFADERGVRIHALYAAEYPDDAARAEYEQVITSRGGLFYELSDARAVEGIIADIQAQDAAELEDDPKVVELDRPDRWYGWLVALVAGLVLLGWRARA